MNESWDYLVVGAGFAGLTLAERLCRKGARCLVVEKRDHLGGNSNDRIDAAGVLVHSYGPHYFRTNAPRIREYLSQFTDWHAVEYRILSYTRGRYWNFPVNLNTFEQWIGRPSTTEEMEAWLAGRRVPIEEPANSEEVILSQAGREFYDLFFLGYTQKQWRRHPRDLDASVCGRIPIRTNRDDRYLREEFQALPREGYTRMFERMVAACGDRLEVRLRTDFRELLPRLQFGHLVFTGAIDEFFDRAHGVLPYRSLRFEPESFSPSELMGREAIAGKKGFWQPAMQVNYPNEEDFTRIVEIKHATGQICENTTIVREYPADFVPGGEAYYPIPAPDARAAYEKYRRLAEQLKNSTTEGEAAGTAIARALASSGCRRVSFIGRLPNYRYYNMDQVVGMALAEAEHLQSEK